MLCGTTLPADNPCTNQSALIGRHADLLGQEHTQTRARRSVLGKVERDYLPPNHHRIPAVKHRVRSESAPSESAGSDFPHAATTALQHGLHNKRMCRQFMHVCVAALYALFLRTHAEYR